MIFSVWDHANRKYDYYQTSDRSSDVNAPKPAHLKEQDLGMAPDDAAWPLPINATLTGSGKYPKGRIATKRTGLARTLQGIPDFGYSRKELGMIGLAGLAAYLYFKRRRA